MLYSLKKLRLYVGSPWLTHGMKCTCYGFADVLRHLGQARAYVERSDNCSFGEQNSFNNQRKDVNFGTYLVDSMLTTLQALELATVSPLFTANTVTYPVKK